MSAKLFHANIRTLRKKANITQEKLSQSMWITQKRYQQWEAGRSQPDIDMIENIASFYQVSISDLFKKDLSELG